MSKIINISGPSAVGKTSLIESLESLNLGKNIRELLHNRKPPYRKYNSEEIFLKKQLWFFENSLNRYNNILNDVHDNFLIDTGIEEVILHTKYYPIVNNVKWNVFEEFKKEVMSKYADKNIADIIIFLTVDLDTLRERKEKDLGNSRTSHKKNLLLYSKQLEFFKRLAEKFPQNVYLIDANNTQVEVLDDVKNLINTMEVDVKITIRDIFDNI